MAVTATIPGGVKSNPGVYLDQSGIGASTGLQLGATGASLGGSLGTVVGPTAGVNSILEGSVISTGGGQLLTTGFPGVSPVNLGGSFSGYAGGFRPVIPILLDHRQGPYPDDSHLPDGTPTFVNFVADANGFRAESDRLPVAPLHAIAQIEKAKQEDAALATSGYEYDSQGGISPLGTTALLSQYGSSVSGSGDLLSQRYGAPLRLWLWGSDPKFVLGWISHWLSSTASYQYPS
ncbi:uncharacterized protein [Macrobrachium rosenbergii]|uniref:uncharacterized protein n=1 Tax=Macrobrachium rosenbergii TaxID=79674 RepID=UPI0034D46458